MSFSSGMSVGASIARGVDRDRHNRGLIINPPRMQRQVGGQQEEHSTKEDPQEVLAGRQRYEQSRDKLADLQKNISLDRAARDYDLAIAALSVGNTSLVEDYLTNYGKAGVSANIDVGDNGEVIVKPVGSGKAFTFADTKDFYSRFFGALKPERSKFAPAGRQRPDQDWEQIADGTKVLDTKSGQIKDTGYLGKNGSRSGSGSGNSKADSLWYEKFDDQLGKHFSRKLLNEKSAEMGDDFSEDFYKNDDGTWNLNQIYKDLSDDEKRQFDVARAQGEQHKADGVAGYTAGVLATRSMDANKKQRTYADFDPDNDQEVEELFDQLYQGSGRFKDTESALAEMQAIASENPKLAFKLEEQRKRRELIEQARNGTTGMGLASARSNEQRVAPSPVSGWRNVPGVDPNAPPKRPGASGSWDSPIDKSRPMIGNADGSFSTEKTITVEIDGKFFNIPTIVNGKEVSEDEAVSLFRDGKNQAVGSYNSIAEAEAAAEARSKKIGRERESEARRKGLISADIM